MSVEKRGKRYSARVGRKRLGTFATKQAAELAERGGDLAAYWEEFVPRRRKSGVRDTAGEEQRWELYVAEDDIASIPFAALTRRDARAWFVRMQSRGLAPQTVKNALNLVRVVCASAVEDELLDANPFADIRVHRSANASTSEGFTVLDPEEQLALLRSVDLEEAHAVGFALQTGLRNSEQWSLRSADIDIDAQQVAVRFSKKDQPPKGGKIRRVPLFGVALTAARWAVEQDREFAFPSPRTGERRFWSSHPTRWEKWLSSAGIRRRVRWYDLRHTCATSLLAGWWGRKWSIDEVRQMLGHSSVTITERYAHLIDDTLQRAARGTEGPRPQTGDLSGATLGIRTPDLRFTNAWVIPGFHGVALRQHWERLAKREGIVALLAAAMQVAYARPDDGFDRVEPMLAGAARAMGGA